MKKNKIFSFVLLLATICNFTLAQAQDNNEKDLKNTIVLANKDKDVEKYEADKLLFMETKDDDTTLLFSDSPETVEQDGILYQDTVKGDTRLLYYHLNGMKEDKKIAVVIQNMSDKSNVVDRKSVV